MLSSAIGRATPRSATAGNSSSSLETKVGKEYYNNESSKFVQGEDRGPSLDKVAQNVTKVAQMGYPRSLVEQIALLLLSDNGSKPPSCRQLAEAVQNPDKVNYSPPAYAKDETATEAVGASANTLVSDVQPQKNIAAKLPSGDHRASLAELIRDSERETNGLNFAAVTTAAIVEHLTCKWIRAENWTTSPLCVRTRLICMRYVRDELSDVSENGSRCETSMAAAPAHGRYPSAWPHHLIPFALYYGSH